MNGSHFLDSGSEDNDDPAVSFPAEAGGDDRASRDEPAVPDFFRNIPMEERFDPGFTGRYRESVWIQEALSEFWADGLFSDVLYRVKAGKEATVYCLKGKPVSGHERIAAKIYRPQQFRAMRNDSLYRLGRDTMDEEGSAVRGRRSALAMKKKTRFGRHLLMTSWNLNEYKILRQMHAAGADVPQPLAHGHNAILMEYFGDDTQAAPILHGLRLPREEAEVLFRRVLDNIELFLSRGTIHGDLSDYNILYWKGEVKIIDMPQAVEAGVHPEAFFLLSRDVERICQYFSKQGVVADAVEIATDLWDRFERGRL